MHARTLLSRSHTEKKGTGQKQTIDQNTLTLMGKHLARDTTFTTKKLKTLIPALQYLAVRSIQHICLKVLDLPFRKTYCPSIGFLVI
jgi:hypothetical protein